MLTIARYSNGSVQVADKRNKPTRTYKFTTERLFKAWYDKNIKALENRSL